MGAGWHLNRIPGSACMAFRSPSNRATDLQGDEGWERNASPQRAQKLLSNGRSRV